MLVRWTDTATRDLTRVCDYTRRQYGPEQARQLALRIYEAAGSLSQYPQLGRLGRKADTREFVFSGLPFLAIYRVHKNVVEIVRILHGAQKWP